MRPRGERRRGAEGSSVPAQRAAATASAPPRASRAAPAPPSAQDHAPSGGASRWVAPADVSPPQARGSVAQEVWGIVTSGWNIAGAGSSILGLRFPVPRLNRQNSGRATCIRQRLRVLAHLRGRRTPVRASAHVGEHGGVASGSLHVFRAARSYGVSGASGKGVNLFVLAQSLGESP